MLKDKEAYLAEYSKDPRPIYDPAITELNEASQQKQL
jgi:hypothetical protein